MSQMKEAVKVSTIFFICLTVVLLSITGGVGYYFSQDRQLMAKNIKDAIKIKQKGERVNWKKYIK